MSGDLHKQISTNSPLFVRQLVDDSVANIYTLQHLNNDSELLKNTHVHTLPHISIQIGDIIVEALIDSGSEVTCIEQSVFQQIKNKYSFPTLPVTSTQLCGAISERSSRIRLQVYLEFLILGCTELFHHPFLVVNKLIRPIIIGVDWLYTYVSSLNISNQILQLNCGKNINFTTNSLRIFYDNNNLVSNSPSNVNCSIKLINNFNIVDQLPSDEELLGKINNLVTINETEQGQLFELLQEFRPVFCKLPGRTTKYFHEIKLNDYTPFLRRPYPIPISLRPEVDAVIDEMLTMGIIKREASQYASPLTAVRKKNGTVRVCLDARVLNAHMIADYESPTPPDELLTSFTKIGCLTTIDLRSSYWQIPLTPNSTQYTAFLYNGKSYTYQVLPFGLKTAVGSFTRAMDVILGPETRSFVLNYIDDLLVVSTNFVEHLQHLKILFKRLTDANININLEKTFFLQTNVKFLGHILSTNGISAHPEKIESISNFPIPKNVKQLRGFLGICNYYRKFNKTYSELTLPLVKLLRKGVPWNWTDEHNKAFNNIKKIFLDTILLKFPDYSRTFYLQSDSSGTALGVELYHLNKEGDHEVLGFASRILRGSELLYTVTEKELLAIIFGLKKFRVFILGFPLVIRTDHFALKFLQHCRILNERLTRWMLYLNEFNYTIEHVRGKENIVCDVLSRCHPEQSNNLSTVSNLPIVAPLFEFSNTKEIQNILKQLRSYLEKDVFFYPILLYLRKFPTVLNKRQINLLPRIQIYDELLIFYDSVSLCSRLVIPNTIVIKIILSFHEQYGHLGTAKLFQIMKNCLYFLSMRQTINKIIRSCEISQKTKFPNKILKGAVHPIITTSPGELVTVD